MMGRMEPVHFLDRIELPRAVGSAIAVSLGEIERPPSNACGSLLERLSPWSFDVIEKEQALDVAGELLVAADELHRQGDHVPAFALEGIQARILDAAIGCGGGGLRPA